MNTIGRMSFLLWVLVSSASVAASQSFDDPRCDTGEGFCAVPIEALLAVPERYDDREVRVTGIAAIEGNGYLSIYASRDAWDIEDRNNSLKLDLSEVKRFVPDPATLDGQMVTVRGTFEFPGGDFESWLALGDISKIKAVQRRLGREEIRRRWPNGPDNSAKK